MRGKEEAVKVPRTTPFFPTRRQPYNLPQHQRHRKREHTRHNLEATYLD